MKDLGAKLKYVINTHVHADHVTGKPRLLSAISEHFYIGLFYTGTGRLKSLCGSDNKQQVCMSAISAAAGAVADVHLKECDKVVFGGRYLKVLATPGHTEVNGYTDLCGW